MDFIIFFPSAAGATFAAGMAFGWTSPVESQIVADDNGECSYKFCVNRSEFSFIAASVGFGALACGFLAGPMMSKVGRKPTLITYSMAMLLGWAVLTFAAAKWMLYVGRVLMGVGFGGSGVVVPIYIGEIAEKSIRGRLIAFFEVNIQTGIFFSYILGYFFQVFTQTLISLIIMAGFAIAMIFIPESPRYHVSFVFSAFLIKTKLSHLISISFLPSTPQRPLSPFNLSLYL